MSYSVVMRTLIGEVGIALDDMASLGCGCYGQSGGVELVSESLWGRPRIFIRHLPCSIPMASAGSWTLLLVPQVGGTKSGALSFLNIIFILQCLY